MISLRHHPVDQRLVVGALRQLLGEERRRDVAAVLRRLARREERDDAPRAVDELQVGDEVAQLLERVALEQRLALDHDQHVELARGEALRHLLVLLELGRVGAEQLAQRIVDLDALDAERGQDREDRHDDRGDDRKAQRDQPDPLDPEGELMLAAAGLRRPVRGPRQLIGLACRQPTFSDSSRPGELAPVT